MLYLHPAFLPQPLRGASFLQLFSQQAHLLSAQLHWSHSQSLQAQTVAHSHASHVQAHVSQGQFSQQAADALSADAQRAIALLSLNAVSVAEPPLDNANPIPAMAIKAARIEIVLTIIVPFHFRCLRICCNT